MPSRSTISARIAVVAALVSALAFIPPIGAMRIDVTEDVFVLITFVVVAVIVGTLRAE
jgi:K+-sensing histidine kinase KdpD